MGMCVGLESGWGPGGGAVPVSRESERRRDGTYRTVRFILCKVKPYGKAYGKHIRIAVGYSYSTNQTKIAINVTNKVPLLYE